MNASVGKAVFLTQSDQEFQDELRRIQSQFRAKQHLSADRNEHDAHKNMGEPAQARIPAALEPQGLRLQTVAEEEISFKRSLDERVLRQHQQRLLQERTADRLMGNSNLSLEPQDHER